jgi:hypothetical protein
MARPTGSESAGKEWRPCPGAEEFYLVSQCGSVLRHRTQAGRPCSRELKPAVKHGYEQVCLSVRDEARFRLVHRLVAEAFLGPPPTPAHQVNHIDGDKRHNDAGNLEWCTASENSRHALSTGLAAVQTPPVHTGESHPQAKLSEVDVREIRWLSARGASSRGLARAYGVSKTQVRHIDTGRHWSQVEGEQEPATVRLADVRGRRLIRNGC